MNSGVPARQPPRRRSVSPVFGQRVRARRHELGLTQEELAERADHMHPTFVGRIERGKQEPSLATILRLARALEVDAADLVRGL